MPLETSFWLLLLETVHSNISEYDRPLFKKNLLNPSIKISLCKLYLEPPAPTFRNAVCQSLSRKTNKQKLQLSQVLL